eukprot:UN03086
MLKMIKMMKMMKTKKQQPGLISPVDVPSPQKERVTEIKLLNKDEENIKNYMSENDDENEITENDDENDKENENDNNNELMNDSDIQIVQHSTNKSVPPRKKKRKSEIVAEKYIRQVTSARKKKKVSRQISVEDMKVEGAEEQLELRIPEKTTD